MNGTARTGDVLAKYKLDSMSCSYDPGQKVEMRGGDTQKNTTSAVFVSVSCTFSKCQ